MVGLGIGIFVVLWIWFIYEIKNAPLVDDYGNIIKEDKDEV